MERATVARVPREQKGNSTYIWFNSIPSPTDIGDLGVSTITVSELQYGVCKSKKRKINKQRVEEFLSPLEILPYDKIAADIYGEIRFQLEKSGKSIGPLDLLIAAQALSRNLILVTNNEKEFKRIQNLKVVNWV